MSRRDRDDRSRSGSNDRGARDDGADRAPREREYMDIDRDEAAFILGKYGSTKKKIARVCGAELDLNENDLKLEMYGTEPERQRARDYIGFVRQQKIGPVHIDVSANVRDDLTVIEVPEDCVGFVMGRGGNTLRSLEDEWGTLMFFAEVAEERDDGKREEMEKLCIFGDLRARRGAELKVMSAIEHKHPGNYVRGGTLMENPRIRGDEDMPGWSIDTMELSDEDYSYALGSKGSTRRKLATASGCILEYVGRLACMSGTEAERTRAREYLSWLIAQRRGSVTVETAGRDDVTVVSVPAKSVGFITGSRGESLRQIEAGSGTFCFTDGNTLDSERETEDVLVFGADEFNRRKAKRLIEQRIEDHKDLNSRGGGGGGGGGRGYGGYDRRDRDYNRRDRYDDRRRDRYDDRRDRDYDRRDRRDRDYDRRDRDRYDDRRRSRSRSPRDRRSKDDHDRRDRRRSRSRSPRSRSRERRDSYDDRRR